MPEPREQRRLIAVLVVDIVGYSRLMGADESGTLARVNSNREVLVDPKIIRDRGRIVKATGDGLLVEFASVVDAIRCAVSIQKTMRSNSVGEPDELRLQYRIAITVGDIIIQGDDIFGDAVNIAARLQELAEPGGIIISEDARRQSLGKVDVRLHDIGECPLKNIAVPVRAYQVLMEPEDGKATVMLPLPRKPSIAVLPFQNLSGDLEQEYFADGIVEEIITALSRMKWLFVIARSSSFSFKGRSVGAKQVGASLGVRYILEGSVRKANNRLRLAGQLVDASTGIQLWAERFDGGLEDIFDLQDQLTANVVSAIAPKLEQAEIERTRRKPTASLDAYDHFLRGMSCVDQWTREANSLALSHFGSAIDLDPSFGAAYGMAARCYSQRKVSGWTIDLAGERQEAERLARSAYEHGKDDALALTTAGHALVFVVDEPEDGLAMIEQALDINPSFAWAWLFSGWAHVWAGNSEEAVVRVNRAIRFSPHDRQKVNMLAALACAYLFAGRFAEAASHAEAAVHENPNTLLAQSVAAVACSLAGRTAQAAKAVSKLRELNPDLRISNLKDWYPIRRFQDISSWEHGLRMAGLPE
ncbi:MAG: adenylate/guanylate cyclase domain-containing protein [Hyphomicrobiaceae bacterium]